MQLNKAITYFHSVINNNLKAFLAIIFQGLLLGIFLQYVWINNLQSDFLIFQQITIIVISIIGLITLWLAYALIISKLYLGNFSRGAIREILKYDVISYMPLSISIILGFAFLNAANQSNYQLWTVSIGFVLMIFLKIFLIILEPPNKEIFLAEKAQQIKIKHVNATNSLNPDKNYVDGIEVDSKYPVRKYIVNDELRNAINLKNSNSGTLKLRLESSDELRYSIGWNSKGSYQDGNLKLFINDEKSNTLILNKDAKNFLDGWNEYQITLPIKSNKIEIGLENTIRDDIYLSISDLSNIKPKKKKNDIVVIIFDGVSLDKIGLYHGNSQADNVSIFFKNSLMFTNAFAQGEWTMPNLVSMSTSLYQSHHKVYDPDLYSTEIPRHIKTLPEVLQENGFNTFGYSSHNRVSPGYGHARGYNRYIYRCTYEEFSDKRDALNTNKYNRDVRLSDIRKVGNNNMDITLNAIKFLRDNQDKNNFLFLHYFDTHQPFFQSPSNISTNEATYNSNPVIEICKKELGKDGFLYLQEIYHQKFKEVDENISLLFDYISKYQDDCTTVIFVSDHDTLLYDENAKNLLAPGKDGRDRYLVEKRLRIPFMIRFPKNTNKNHQIIDHFVEGNLTIMPTILEIAGIQPPEGIDGISIIKNNQVKKKLSKNYTIAESNFKEKYELLLKAVDFTYFLQTGRNRITNEIEKHPGVETFYTPDGKIITDAKTIQKLKKKVKEIAKENKLTNKVIDAS